MMKIIGVPKIRWMDKRYIFWVLSALFIVAGIGAFFSQEPKKLYDVEFIGGTKAQVTLANEVGGKPVNVTEDQLTDLLKKHNVQPGDRQDHPAVRGGERPPGRAWGRGRVHGRDVRDGHPGRAEGGNQPVPRRHRGGAVQPNDIAGLGTKSLLPAERGDSNSSRLPTGPRWPRSGGSGLDCRRSSVWPARTWPRPSCRTICRPARSSSKTPISKPPPCNRPGWTRPSKSRKRPDRNVNLDEYKGGVGVVVSGLQPATLEDLRTRIMAQLSTPEYECCRPAGWRKSPRRARPAAGTSMA